MSIDRDVNSVVEAYRGNDYALQEKYAVDKQLIDLLALQKLKSERDAAAKEIQRKAQVPPTTVAGQLEKENLEAIKQQIVGGMPQEGILAAAQGGMVRGFAEGGDVDPNEEAVDVDPNDEAVAVTPNKSSEDEKIQKEIDRLVKQKTRYIGPLTGMSYNTIPEGSPMYRQTEKEAREKAFGEAVDDILEDITDPRTVQSEKDYINALRLQELRDTGQTPIEELYKLVKSNQLPEPKVDTDTGTGTDTDTSGATTEPPVSLYDRITGKFGATFKDLVDNLDVQGRIEGLQTILDKIAKIDEPEERKPLDVISTAMRGRGLYGAGGASYALTQDELARKKRSKEYKKMLLDNEKQIYDLAQTLGDKEMAIKLTAANEEYAREVAATARKIENEKDRTKFILDALKLMADNAKGAITDNPFYQGTLYNEGPEAANEFARNLQETLIQSPYNQTLIKMLEDLGVSVAGMGGSNGRKPLDTFNTKS